LEEAIGVERAGGEIKMAMLDEKKKLLQCKIVYYGPGKGGKTTNLQYVHRALKSRIKSELLSIKTSGDRTLFFDFLPVGIGKIGDYDVMLQVYTVPGQIKYNATRKLVLRGVDGIVFVADSLVARRVSNVQSLENLGENLADYGKTIYKVPIVLQYNKRDLEAHGVSLLPIDVMEADLNKELKTASFPASAIQGGNVMNTLKTILKLTIKHVHDYLALKT
jgi:signal recognition particle receptor subunit beta